MAVRERMGETEKGEFFQLKEVKCHGRPQSSLIPFCLFENVESGNRTAAGRSRSRVSRKMRKNFATRCCQLHVNSAL